MPLKDRPKLFKYRHFEPEIILLCLRWYLRYSLSYRDLEEMMAERGLSVAHTTIYRWVQHFAPVLRNVYEGKEMPSQAQTNQRLLASRWDVHQSQREWMYLYRAIDSDGATVEFMLSSPRHPVSAKRFFRKALRARHTIPPRVINIDRNPSYP